MIGAAFRGEMLKTWQFYWVFLAFAVSAGAGLMSIGLMKLYPTEALMAFVPFLRGEDGKIAYGEVFFGATEPEVFTPVS